MTPVGHEIQLSGSDGDCPAGIIGTPDFDAKTAGTQDTVLVPPGGSKTASVPLLLNRDDFVTPSIKSPRRCTAILSATTVPAAGDPNPSNNMAPLVIDIVDHNDF